LRAFYFYSKGNPLDRKVKDFPAEKGPRGTTPRKGNWCEDSYAKSQKKKQGRKSGESKGENWTSEGMDLEKGML